MIRWVADAFLILLAGFLLLFAFAVVDGIVGALWDAWTSRKSRRVDRAGWFTREELDRIMRLERKDYVRDAPAANLWGRQMSEGLPPPDQDAKVEAVRDETLRFHDRQVSRYLARKRW